MNLLVNAPRTLQPFTTNRVGCDRYRLGSPLRILRLSPFWFSTPRNMWLCPKTERESTLPLTSIPLFF
jgi:hypothetical protein